MVCYFYAVRRHERKKNKPEVNQERNHAQRFHPVIDSSKHRVRGLWKRGKRYYAQVRMVGADGSSKPRRISLGVVSLNVAREELERVRTENRSGALSLPGRQPTFAEFADEYLASSIYAQKRPIPGNRNVSGSGIGKSTSARSSSNGSARRW